MFFKIYPSRKTLVFLNKILTNIQRKSYLYGCVVFANCKQKLPGVKLNLNSGYPS